MKTRIGKDCFVAPLLAMTVRGLLSAITIKALLIAHCTLLIISCASSSVEKNVPESEDGAGVVRLAPFVSEKMLSADFWISQVKYPDKIRMTRLEIASWNRASCSIAYPADSDFYIISDLRKIDGVMTSLEIRSGMKRYSPSSVWYKKVGAKNGTEIKALSQKDWRAIFEEMNHSGLESMNYFMGARATDEKLSKKDHPVKKAICVRRSNLRLVPDDTFYSDDENYWYDDAAQNSGILMGEPVLVLWESKGGGWLYVKCSYCTGWIHSSDVAFCSDEEFLRYFDYAEKKSDTFVTVTAERFSLDSDYAVQTEDFSEIPELFMGTYLFTSDWNDEEFQNAFPDRIPYASFLAEIPYRKSDGTLGIALASIPASICEKGLVDYTARNVLNLAFKPLGQKYGWGGMAGSRDCSEYLMDIFRCFGFIFPRNSRSQLAMPGKTLDFEEKSVQERKKLLAAVETGTPMGFPGHVFLYLGKVGSKNYVISALGAYYVDSESDEKEELSPINANSVNVNTLDVLRKNGKSWLEVLTKAKILEDDGNFSDNRIFLNPKWECARLSKINSGAALLYKARKNRKNITVALNAGHGTKGGTSVKTLSHPDSSPKITGGTNEAGAVESIAVSSGMTFKDGKSESEVNLRTARLLRDELLKSGFDVLMIRDSDDTRLDNIARTVISNNNAKIHIAIHFDGDNEKKDKGCFYCSIPDGLKSLPNVKKHYGESTRLGDALVSALRDAELPIYNDGKMEVDLTQTSYSTIPTVDVELGNEWTDTETESLEKRAKALCEGVKAYFN